MYHHTKLRVGQAEPNINCTVYGNGQIEVQNNAELEAMGSDDTLECYVYLYGSGKIGNAKFENGTNYIKVGK